MTKKKRDFYFNSNQNFANFKNELNAKLLKLDFIVYSNLQISANNCLERFRKVIEITQHYSLYL